MTNTVATLHIEHPITDFATWAAAFGRFADRRRDAGTVEERVSRPVDDDRYILIDLDFPGVEQARAFEQFLRTEVWSTPESSPALAGAAMTRICTLVEHRRPGSRAVA